MDSRGSYLFRPPNESAASKPEWAVKHPLNILSPKSHARLNSSSGTLPWQLRYAGEHFVLVNPADVAARIITESAVARVFSEYGVG
jgi:anaerobic selenocysteine-containing dehydrogenase